MTPLEAVHGAVAVSKPGFPSFWPAPVHPPVPLTVSVYEALCDAEPVPVSHLTTLLQLPGATSAVDPALDVALLAVEGNRIALVVDEFVEQRDSIIRESGLPPSHAGMTSGAIPLEDGTVAVMLDADAIFEKAKLLPTLIEACGQAVFPAALRVPRTLGRVFGLGRFAGRAEHGQRRREEEELERVHFSSSR